MLLWIILAVVYLAMLVFLGLATLNKGHTVLFFVGLFIPLLWIVGAIMAPTNAAQTAAARSSLR